MKKTAAATKKKASNKPATAAPAQEAVTVASQPKKATRPARKAKAAKPAASTKKVAPIATKVEAKPASKKDIVLALIGREQGSTLAEIMEATGWQKHTIRGFISIANKGGAKIESSKSEAGARTYKAA